MLLLFTNVLFSNPDSIIPESRVATLITHILFFSQKIPASQDSCHRSSNAQSNTFLITGMTLQNNFHGTIRWTLASTVPLRGGLQTPFFLPPGDFEKTNALKTEIIMASQPPPLFLQPPIFQLAAPCLFMLCYLYLEIVSVYLLIGNAKFIL